MAQTDNDTQNQALSSSAETAKAYLLGILERMDIEAEVDIVEEDERIILDIRVEQAERVIGRRGQVIDALQHLVGKMTYKDRSVGRGKPIVLDADGYRAKTIERLEELARRMADKALESRETVELNPMSAHDRRIIHLALADLDGITTRSEGTGDRRRVLVVPE